MLMAGNDCFLIQLQNAHGNRIPGRIAQTQDIVALFQHITAVFFPETCQVLQVKDQFQGFCLAGSQIPGLPEGRQGLVFLAELAVGGGYIELRHFLAGIGGTGIGDHALHLNLGALHSNTCTAHGKIRIAQTKAEGVGRFHAEAVIITVAYVDAFFVEFLFQISILRAIFHGKGDVFVPLHPGGSQFAGGADRTADHIREGMTAFGAQLADVQNGIDAGNFLQEAHVHGGTAVDGQDEFFVLVGQILDVLFFSVGEQEIAGFYLPVAAFTGLTGQHIDTAIRIAGGNILIGDLRAIGEAEMIVEHTHNGFHFQKIAGL